VLICNLHSCPAMGFFFAFRPCSRFLFLPLLASDTLAFAQVLSGLSYLHNQETPIVHLDIKAGNLLITKVRAACLFDV
jgi:hypothetical protein